MDAAYAENQTLPAAIRSAVSRESGATGWSEALAHLCACVGAHARQQRRSDAAAEVEGLYGWGPTIGRTRTVVVQSWYGSGAPALMTSSLPAASAAAI